MTTSVADHYAKHLAPIYSWMVGDFGAASTRADTFYAEIALPSGSGHIAVDLGCGHGVHSIPLARRGFRVLALDTSVRLLDELKVMAGDLPIQAITADLMHFEDYLGSDAAALIACMGDTLTHLPALNAVHELIRVSVRNLSPHGMLTYSFRDYATRELTDTDRFIPVRSDAHRIHTCFLEYQLETVLVHDIVHTLVDSTWRTSVSAYSKIRIDPEVFVTTVESHGLSLVHRSTDCGLIYLAFRR